MSKPLSREECDAIRAWADELVGLAEAALDLFRDRVLGSTELRALLEADLYRCETSYAGLVDARGDTAYYGGRVRVVGPTGAEVALFDGADYLDHIAERVVPWSYMKVPYLRALGYAGLEDGPASGVYRVNSLARLNVARGMPTPRADDPCLACATHAQPGQLTIEVCLHKGGQSPTPPPPASGGGASL